MIQPVYEPFKVLVTTVSQPRHPTHQGVALSTIVIEFPTYKAAKHAETTINNTASRLEPNTKQSALLLADEPASESVNVSPLLRTL